MKKNVIFASVIFFIAFLSPTHSQSRDSDEALYRFHFAVHVLTGEQRTTYNYELILMEDHDDEGRIRALSKVPLPNGEDESRFIETGTRIDVEYRERSNGIYLDVEMGFAELSEPDRTGLSDRSIIHEWQCEAEVLLLPGQSMIVSRGDEVNGDRRYELEVSAEKLQ